MSTATRCSRCGYASASVLPFCGYCYRRFPRRRTARSDAYLRTGPAAAEAWARHRIEGPGAAPASPPHGLFHRTRSAAPLPAPERYRSLVGLGVVAQMLLAAVGLVAVVVALAHVTLLALTIPWDAVSDSVRANAGDWAQRVADDGAMVGVAGLIVTGVVFICWGTLAYTNLPHLGIAHRRWWTLWTVAGWLIPGANLFVPKLIMDDVWRGSNPSLPPRPGPGWVRRPVGSVVHQWWLLWLGAPAVYVLVRAGVPDTATSLVQKRWSEGAAVLAALVLVGASRAARQMVAIVSLAQHQRASILAMLAETTRRIRTTPKVRPRPLHATRPLVAARAPAPPESAATPGGGGSGGEHQVSREGGLSLSDAELREALTSW